VNRLTPEIVSDAFARTGMEPLQLSYFSLPAEGQRRQCCGLYAVAVSREPVSPHSGLMFLNRLSELAGVSIDYARAFAWGWDCEAPDSSRRWSREERQGFEDGRAAWLAVGEGKEARRA